MLETGRTFSKLFVVEDAFNEATGMPIAPTQSSRESAYVYREEKDGKPLAEYHVISHLGDNGNGFQVRVEVLEQSHKPRNSGTYWIEDGDSARLGYHGPLLRGTQRPLK